MRAGRAGSRSTVVECPRLDGEIGRVCSFAGRLNDAERVARSPASRHDEGAGAQSRISDAPTVRSTEFETRKVKLGAVSHSIDASAAMFGWRRRNGTVATSAQTVIVAGTTRSSDVGDGVASPPDEPFARA